MTTTITPNLPDSPEARDQFVRLRLELIGNGVDADAIAAAALLEVFFIAAHSEKRLEFISALASVTADLAAREALASDTPCAG